MRHKNTLILKGIFYIHLLKKQCGIVYMEVEQDNGKSQLLAFKSETKTSLSLWNEHENIVIGKKIEIILRQSGKWWLSSIGCQCVIENGFCYAIERRFTLEQIGLDIFFKIKNVFVFCMWLSFDNVTELCFTLLWILSGFVDMHPFCIWFCNLSHSSSSHIWELLWTKWAFHKSLVT